MQHLITRFKTVASAMLAITLLLVPSVGIVPLAAYAQDCTTVAAPDGVDSPAGASAGTYTYNSCGYFENEHYTWSPTTHTATPKVVPTYNYNSSTGMCDEQTWQWSPVKNDWYLKTTSVTTPPNGEACIGKPAPQPVTTTSGSATTGPSTTVNNTGTNNQTVNDSNNSTLNNTVDSQATSGNASVIGNVSPNGSTGGATTGSAQAIANVINLLQSSSSANKPIATFTANINGDVQGDLTIDPSMLQPTSTSSDLNNKVDVNVDNNGSINNNINLAAQSGDATVQHNINAGDATSGNAQAIANVVNMMNTLVSANQSFLGVVNINGNLNGNILMPQNFLDSLIASNAPHENVDVSQSTIDKLAGNVTNNDSITNNVTSTAVSGNASATKNDNSGALSGASTGSAQTNVTIFNLANKQISGGNTMLVFVNVVGKWVGVIMDAPAGATAAALGGGLNANSTVNNEANYNVKNTGTITNNIGVSAKTGNATVDGNINAGNAQSGDAKTAVNLANLTSDTVNLTGWFGILFINVFGNWNGNFGVATSLPAAGQGGDSTGADSSAQSAQPFGFNPTASTGNNQSSRGSGNSSATSNNSSTGNGSSSSSDDDQLQSLAGKVLGASAKTTAIQTPAQIASAHRYNTLVLIGGVMVLAGMLIAGIDQRLGRRSS